MSETKEMLEATVKGLQDKVSQLNMDLKAKQKELEDVIGNTVGDYEFDCGMFEYEFNINYDNKIELSDLTFTDGYELAEAIMNRIDNYFKIEEDDKTND